MSKSITVPTTIENDPLIITIAGVSYTLAPGASLTVPDEVAYELARMLGSVHLPAPNVEPPFTLDDVNARLDALEANALPEYPEDDGTYALQLVMEDGEATLAWEAVESSATPES